MIMAMSEPERDGRSLLFARLQRGLSFSRERPLIDGTKRLPSFDVARDGHQRVVRSSAIHQVREKFWGDKRHINGKDQIQVRS